MTGIIPNGDRVKLGCTCGEVEVAVDTDGPNLTGRNPSRLTIVIRRSGVSIAALRLSGQMQIDDWWGWGD